MNQLSVLSAVTRLPDGEARQKDIVESTALTKGAVSNNCKKLVGEGVLVENDGLYSIDEERLLSLYRTHVEEHLRRREVPEGFEHYNDVRTATKRRMPEIFEGATGEILRVTLLRVLERSKEDAHLKTLRDVFHRADTAIVARAEADSELEGETKQELAMLAVSMDHAPEYVDGDLAKRAVAQMADELEENLSNARS